MAYALVACVHQSMPQLKGGLAQKQTIPSACTSPCAWVHARVRMRAHIRTRIGACTRVRCVCACRHVGANHALISPSLWRTSGTARRPIQGTAWWNTPWHAIRSGKTWQSDLRQQQSCKLGEGTDGRADRRAGRDAQHAVAGPLNAQAKHRGAVYDGKDLVSRMGQHPKLCQLHLHPPLHER